MSKWDDIVELNIQMVFEALKVLKYKLPTRIKEFRESDKGRCIVNGWILEKDNGSPGSDFVWGWYAGDLKVTPVIIQSTGEVDGASDGMALQFEDEDGNTIRINGMDQLIKVIQDKLSEVQKEFPGLS